MEVPSEDGEMPVPLNSTYGGHGHMIHHHDPPPPSHNHHLIIPSSAAAAGVISSSSTLDHDEGPTTFKKLIRYRECLKNHAAAMGGNATDGCGEFMPSGDDGTLEALTCSACHCHRNFHRKEIDGEPDPCTTYHVNSRMARKLFVGHHALGYHHHGGGALRAVAPPPPHQMIMSYNIGGGGGSQSDEQEPPPHHQVVKKRFRTKFTAEQKEKMLDFAEKVGWKIQKQEEGVVQSFCQEVGVKRRVLKVWMHNNKHSLAKKNNIHSHDHPQEHQLV